MPIPSETIALPIVKGLDVQTDARLLQAPSLLEAENTQFSGGGAKKRRGHTSLRVRTEDPVVPEYTSGGILAPGQLPLDWYYGLGYGTSVRGTGEEDERAWTFPQPEVKKLRGVANRDNETVVWDGFRLLSYLPSQITSQAPMSAEVQGQAVMPSLRATPFAKFSEVQTQPEFADNGVTKIFAWISGTSVKYAIYDSSSDALIAKGTLAVTTGDYIRCFTLGNWMHIAARDNDDDRVKLFSISSSEPNSIVYRSYGDATHFDIWKVSDSEALLARSNADGFNVTWIGTTGSGSPSRAHFQYTPTVTAAGAQTLISVGYTAAEIGVAWYNGSNTIGYATFNTSGVMQRESSFSASGVVRLTLSPKLAQITMGYQPWDVFWDNGVNLYTQRFWRIGTAGVSTDVGTGTLRTRFRMRLASRAWRVGDRTFIWAGYNSTLQSTWFLLDEGLLPVGKLNFAVADVSGLGSNGRLVGINFKSGEDYDSDTPRTHLALSYKLRVAPNDNNQTSVGIYTEPTPQAVELDFLPRLRAAQAGRALYIAGAQLWSYDGQEVVEAGFHLGPEVSLAAGVGGTLDTAGIYSYRVDLCYRNAQNEEVRSLSILTNSLDLAGVNSKITLTIPTILTRRSGTYFLIYRNAMSSGVPLVNWWLLNSRDPSSASFLANDLSVTSVTYIDTGAVSDTDIQTRELHPASDTYVQPISAPACEIIAAGRDRLWVAGGELPPGKVAPSRLFEVGETPGFNAYLEFQVDRSSERVSAIGFIGEVGVFFRKNSTYLLDSDGPDNNASGYWNPVRLALADTGAVSQDSVVRTSQGLIFQSPAGFRLVGPGGALSPIGLDIDAEAKDFTVVGSFLVEKDQEARFYGSSGDGTYTFNYLYNTWAHWSCSGVGVSRGPDGLALLAREDGELWIETDDTYTDAGTPYIHRIRTSWLHGGNVGDFQRVRRIGGLGRFGSLDTPSHILRLEIFYDEREFWEERVEWEMPDSTVNGDTWGTSTWGEGVWGDNSATISNLEDLTWEWVRRPARQKCSVFSIALEDVNTDGPGFILSAFTLELARKSGLNRTPERTGTGTNR